jgi:galactokinase
MAAGATPECFADLDLRRRVEHFRAESMHLVPAAAMALTVGDMPGFAAAVAHSQTLAENLLGNQVPETSALVALAMEHGGLASSAFGAGFGGAVWALIPECDQAAFATGWLAAYHQRFPLRRATVHRIRPGAGLHSLS